MELIPLASFLKENKYGFTPSGFKSLVARNPKLEGALKRLSARNVLIDTDQLDEIIGELKYYAIKRPRKQKAKV